MTSFVFSPGFLGCPKPPGESTLSPVGDNAALKVEAWSEKVTCLHRRQRQPDSDPSPGAAVPLSPRYVQSSAPPIPPPIPPPSRCTPSPLPFVNQPPTFDPPPLLSSPHARHVSRSRLEEEGLFRASVAAGRVVATTADAGRLELPWARGHTARRRWSRSPREETVEPQAEDSWQNEDNRPSELSTRLLYQGETAANFGREGGGVGEGGFKVRDYGGCWWQCLLEFN